MTSTTNVPFDYDGFLSSLEVFRLPEPPQPPSDAHLAEWVWPPLRSYNGFGGEERVRVWQIQRWAQDHGLYPKPAECSTCGSRYQIGFHSENYYDPWASIPLCRECHKAVHKRFWQASEWSAFQALHGGSREVQWFELLPSTPIDLAAWLTRCESPSALMPVGIGA